MFYKIFMLRMVKIISIFLLSVCFFITQANSQPVPALLNWDGDLDNMDALPKTLAETGFDPTKTDIFIPYEVNVPQYRNFMITQRYVYVPMGQKIIPGDTLNYTFPVGTTFFRAVFIDKFYGNPASRIPIEVQIQIRLKDNTWGRLAYGYYEDGTNALVTIDSLFLREINIKIAEANLPYIDSSTTPYKPADFVQVRYERNGFDCESCHWDNSANGFITQQLNKGTQLADLVAKGVLASVPTPGPAIIPKWFSPTDPTATLEQKALSYLGGNCGHCHLYHRLESGMTTDLSYFKPIAKSKIFSNDSNRSVIAGKPIESQLILRMLKVEMPQSEVSVADAASIKMLWDWIGAEDGTPAPVFPGAKVFGVGVNPNPSHGLKSYKIRANLHHGILNISNADDTGIMLYDTQGRSIFINKISKNSYMVREALQTGVYFVKVGKRSIPVQNIAF